ncbi:cytochrome c [Phenylobacterium sp.]|jgi:cytochrome c556|uniref:c-type cytochrome n=1 Tax=Phenylobacterium sp. TaxID=1871053 RepID=UPI002F94884F
MAGKVWIAAAALAAGMTVAAGGALAHNTKGEVARTPGHKAALVRHDNFEKLGAAFKAINDELRKSDPDTQLVARNAATMKALSTQLPTWFPKGSGKEARPKSEAKPNIWTDSAGFSSAASNAQVQISKLQQAAAGGDLGAVRGQIRATGGACKGCHDKFREEKKS